MDLLKKTQDLSRQFGIQPARSKGQNFLICEDTYDLIIENANLSADDVVLEVGPGLGFLTERLAKRVKKVIAVELDDRLAGALKFRLKKERVENVEVVNENVLDINSQFSIINSQEIQKYKIVANLPYNITSIFLRKFLSNPELRPEMMVLMLQKEVAERIAAKPGDMSLLALSVQFYSDPEIVGNVSKKCFWPEPKVESAIIKFQIPNSKFQTIDFKKEILKLAKFGFSAKRKMLKNNLAGGLKISQKEVEDMLVNAGYGAKIRAQELSLDDWLKLFGIFKPFMV